MNHAAAREMFGLLYGHPRETCPHCHRPRHRVKCVEWVKYDARMDPPEQPIEVHPAQSAGNPPDTAHRGPNAGGMDDGRNV